jgi:hypothetical protein
MPTPHLLNGLNCVKVTCNFKSENDEGMGDFESPILFFEKYSSYICD